MSQCGNCGSAKAWKFTEEPAVSEHDPSVSMNARRLAAMALYDAGMESPAVARIVGVHKSTVVKWAHRSGRYVASRGRPRNQDRMIVEPWP